MSDILLEDSSSLAIPKFLYYSRPSCTSCMQIAGRYASFWYEGGRPPWLLFLLSPTRIKLTVNTRGMGG